LPTATANRFLPWVLLLGPCLVHGRGLDLSVDLDSLPLATQFTRGELGKLREAKVKSGVGVTLGRDWLELDVGYALHGRSVGGQRDGELTQRVQTRLKSRQLDSLLGVTVGLNTDFVYREGGDAYRHQVQPALSGRLGALARLKVEYRYVLDKPSRFASEQENRGYSLVMDGEYRGGQLSWLGRLSSSDLFDHRDIRTRSTDTLDLTSRYQLLDSLHLELSGALRNQTLSPEQDTRVITERRYGAALGWSPSGRYELGVRFDTVEQGLEPGDGVRGGGSISWYPHPDLELKLDYGHQLVEGSAGWMLHTKFDLSS
jgi:hypothetical protein